MITDYLLDSGNQNFRINLLKEKSNFKFFNSESDIHALEILKNQNLLVLGTESLEINKEVQDTFEVKDGEDLQVTTKEK